MTLRGEDPRETKDAVPRLHRALDVALEWAASNRPRTHRSRQSLARVVKAAMPDKPLTQLGALDLERLKRDRRAAGASPGTVNRGLAFVKHASALWFRDHGWITAEQFAALRAVSKLREPPGRVRQLSDDERQRLYTAITKSPIRPIVITALLTGMRRGTVVGLRRDELDLRGKRITTTRTKNGKRLSLPIAPSLEPVLRSALANVKGNEFVFLSTRGVPYTLDGFSTVWHRLTRAAGLADLRFHDLRHDFASRVRRSGAGLDVIQELLGHSTLAMAGRYAHLADEHLHDAVKGLT
jgi:integrase